MDSAPTQTQLEPLLQRTDAALAAAERQLAATLKILRALRRATAEGMLANLPARIADAAAGLAATAAPLAAAAHGFAYDFAAAVADGSYLGELAAAAEAAGLTLIRRDGRIIAFPVELRLLPRDQAVQVGKARDRRLRPAFLADQLKRLQSRPDRFNARAFLDRLLRPYTLLARAEAPGWRPETPGAGPLVALVDLYEVLTLSPLAAADYPREEFAADLLRLDRTPAARSGRGHRFEFAGSTGKKGGKRLTMYDEQGGQHDYFALRLILEP